MAASEELYSYHRLMSVLASSDLSFEEILDMRHVLEIVAELVLSSSYEEQLELLSKLEEALR